MDNQTERKEESGEVKNEAGSRVINLVVKDQQGGETQFRVKATTKFDKIMEAFCNKKGLNKQEIRFHFDGRRIQATDTPELLEMEDKDVVDAFIEQHGGM